MAYPISVKKNNYLDNPKSSTIYTPEFLARRLFEIVHPTLVTNSYFDTHKPYKDRIKVLDPAVGTGRLLAPFHAMAKVYETYGIDILEEPNTQCEYFYEGKFEHWNPEWVFTPLRGLAPSDLQSPDLIMCNPPFNGCEGRKLYPELFLRCIHSYFGSSLPVVLVVPMGFRLNQRRGSKRWQYLRDNWKISSIMTLPIDMFGDVLFHSEILFFNFPNGSLQPHYFYAEN